MVNRRTMAEAATLATELAAFVKSGVPHRDESPSLSTVDTTESQVKLPPAEPPSEQRPRSHRASVPQPDNTTIESLPAPDTLLDEILVPITTKLRRKTVQALRRTYLEQKLRSARPATQQEIIQEAVEYWLKRNAHRCG